MFLTYEKVVNSEKLHGEIQALNIAGFLGVNQLTCGHVQVVFSGEPTQAEQDSVAATVTAHTTTNPQDAVVAAIKTSLEFGGDLIKQWGVRVGVTGKTQAEIDSLLDNLDFLKIGMGLQTGTITFCKSKLEALTPYTGFTQADKDWMLGKINVFLGV